MPAPLKVFALLVLLIWLAGAMGCASSPQTSIGDVFVVTTVTGQNCWAERGSAKASESAQEGAGDASGDQLGGEGALEFAQQGALSSLLTSSVGCDP